MAKAFENTASQVSTSCALDLIGQQRAPSESLSSSFGDGSIARRIHCIHLLQPRTVAPGAKMSKWAGEAAAEAFIAFCLRVRVTDSHAPAPNVSVHITRMMRHVC